MKKHSEIHTNVYKYSLKFLNQSVSLHTARLWMKEHRSNHCMLTPSASVRQAAQNIIVLGVCGGLAVNQC